MTEKEKNLASKVLIVGGGFSGLTLAYELARLGVKVDLYESKKILGGILQTRVTEQGVFEPAANGLLNCEFIQSRLDELKLSPLKPRKESRRRFFLIGTKMKQWPLSFFETIQTLFAFIVGRMKSKNTFSPQPQETIDSWGNRLFGIAFTDKVIKVALQGIYGDQIGNLSAESVVGAALQRRKDPMAKSTGLISFTKGMKELCDRLHEACIDLGVEFHLGQVFDLHKLGNLQAGAIVFCGGFKELKHFLNLSFLSASLTSVQMKLQVTSGPPKGFGVLIQKNSSCKALGFLFNSSIFENRLADNAADDLSNETAIYGSDFTEASEELLVQQALKDRQHMSSSLITLKEAQVFQWQEGFPIYDQAWHGFLKVHCQCSQFMDISTFTKTSGTTPLYAHGNFTGALGLSAIWLKSSRGALELQKRQGVCH